METIVSDGDIKDMFHPALEWRECDDEVEAGWGHHDGRFSPPLPPSEEELAASAVSMKSQLMDWASEMLAPLQDAVDLEEATEEELTMLRAWKQYRVNLNRVEGQEGYPQFIDWPVAPV